MLQTLIQKNQFDALFSRAGIGVMCLDSRGEILAVNSYILNEFGYGKNELVGNKIEILIPERYKKQHIGHRKKYNKHPAIRPMGTGMELTGVKKNGSELPVEIALGYFESNDETYSLVFISNISKKVAFAQAIRQLNEDLEHKVKENTKAFAAIVEQLTMQVKEKERKEADLVQKLAREKEMNELKSRFVSIASHEFRTPLSSVLSSTYLLAKYTKEEEQPQREKHIQRIVSSVSLLNEILNDFLSVEKIEEGNLQPNYARFSVEKLAEECIEDMRHMLRKDQTLSYSHKGKENEANLDVNMLKHVLTNLISNAIKYSPPGSAIAISSQRTKNTLVVRVKDSGIGISAEDQKHLFKRFYRGANANHAQGTGLGLSIVEKYVALMNGKIECASAAGKGTTFTITFNHQQA
jgi:PAS domain S-box-containing protein